MLMGVSPTDSQYCYYSSDITELTWRDLIQPALYALLAAEW